MTSRLNLSLAVVAAALIGWTGVASAKLAIASVDFSSPSISTSGECRVSTTGAAYNGNYGSSWILYNRGASGIRVDFSFPNDQTAENFKLSLTHLTSYSQNARGNGYAPVTILVNGNEVATRYDVAEHHNGSHAFETDEWAGFDVRPGPNTLTLSYGNEAQTTYWIKQLTITAIGNHHSERPVVPSETSSTASLPVKNGVMKNGVRSCLLTFRDSAESRVHFTRFA